LNQVLCESICVLISWYDKQDPSLTRVDNPVFLPLNTKIRVLTTSNDVIHSWALPAAALKVDSIPGRLNQFDLQISKRGVFRGQCSEFCGVGHAFMPIVVVSVLPEDFDYFLLCWVNHLNSDSSLNLLR
jgi:cytochrome c oxidase subunit 2